MPKILDTTSDIEDLHSIAANLKNNLKKMGIKTMADLLWYFPWRYDDLSDIKEIKDLQEGELASIKVKIKNIKVYRSFRKKMIITEMLASDGSDDIQIRWFRQKYVSQVLKIGDMVYLSGKAQKQNLIWQMASPAYEKEKDDPIHSARLVPIYHLSGRISQKQLRFLIDRALKTGPAIQDFLPAEIKTKEKFPDLSIALKQIHFPSDKKLLKKATQRLKFQELFYLQCKYQLAKQNYQSQPTYKIKAKAELLKNAKNNLDFSLTNDQESALNDIVSDIGKNSPMNRLIEGDVGSGKTVVALLSALLAMEQGKQVAFMAPTEILAYQHFQNALKTLPKKYSNQIALLTKNNQNIGSHQKTKKELLKSIESGQAKLIVGTHALIQEKIIFEQLALLIIDEQHPFAVKQRQSLKNKNKDKKVPHLLTMTATPIPRTLALTLYGDLDISLIKEKPAGRRPVQTFLVPEKKRADAYQFIKDKIKLGQQAFVICPLIDESDKLGVKSVTQEYEKLDKDIYPDLEIRYLHGKLSSQEKEQIMSDFKKNKFPILVATSVIEVGVDIPGATMMLIESAERFGLSQLHQFRGRVGRNDLESFCLLFTTDSSKLNTRRLQALTKSNDGFELSELDLELRGSGEIFGTKQTGLMKLKIAKLSDTELIKKAQYWAQEIINNSKYKSDKNLNSILAKLKTETHLE